MISAWFHSYADGRWLPALEETLTALDESGLAAALQRQDSPLNVGIVGAESARDKVRGYLNDRKVFHRVKVEAVEGWEQVTLTALHAATATMSEYDQVLYLHAKGSAWGGEEQSNWRTAMLYWNVHCWTDALDALRDHDTYGAFWINKENRFYGGNEWWATPKYLKSLPVPPVHSRYDAEAWIGYNDPKAFDACPGWPGEEVFKIRKDLR